MVSPTFSFVPVKATIRKQTFAKIQGLEKAIGMINFSAKESEMHAKCFCLVGNLRGKRRLTEKGIEGIP